MTRRQKTTLFRILFGIACFVIGLFFRDWWKAGLMLAAWLVAGYDVIWSALRNLVRGHIFDEKFLMSLATVCALAMRDWGEAAAVMLFFQVGELFEQLAVERSRKSIAGLMDLRPDFANVLCDGEERSVDPEEVTAGDILLVRPGERIAVDGTVTEGEGSLDTSKVTGESVPAEVGVGDRVISGSVNLSGVLKIRAESAYAHSTVARILTLVDSAAEKKATAERMITKFARFYTPSVIVAAVLLAAVPPLLIGAPFSDWLSRALSFLVISCPCALVISVPLSFFSGMGAASKLGIVVKGGSVLEQLARLKTVVLDKTGTLTQGSFRVLSVQSAAVEEAELLELAAACEQYSNHPIAQAIRAACPRSAYTAKDIKELAGNGILATVDGHTVAVGNRRLMERCGVAVPDVPAAGTTLYLARETTWLGAIVIGDTVREGAREALSELKALGVEKTVMLTGDNAATAQQFAQECGITEYHAQLLPQDKVDCLRGLPRAADATLAFVGDGVNDAPVLAMADVGIAMGGVGSDAAVEAADVVLLKDDIRKLPTLLQIARRTCGIARANILLALGVKGICLLLGALGYAPMWVAIFADVGVAVLAILNSLRALRLKKTR